MDNLQYHSDLFKFIMQYEQHHSNKCEGYPPFSYEERIFRLLCNAVEQRDKTIRQLESKVETLWDKVINRCDE